MQFGLWARSGSRNHELYGGPDPPREGAILGKVSPIVRYRDFLSWAVQKRLNRLICRLGCGLGWVEGSVSSIVFARWRQCALQCGHFGATWQIRPNRPSAAAMRSYVKLLWPLVVFVPDYTVAIAVGVGAPCVALIVIAVLIYCYKRYQLRTNR